MQTPRLGAFSPLFAVFLLGGVTVACGGNKDGASEKKAPVVASKTDAIPAADDAPADAGPAAEGSSSTGSAPATAGTPAGTTGSAAGAQEEGGSGGTGGSGGSGGAEDPAEGTTGAPAVDVPALLKEIKNRKTKDARAQTALTEAEAAGAEPAAIASALNSRGEALFATPERARVFFEMANEKDPKATSPAFNLAKQAAIVGELEEAKKWLTIVHERKGKKLLKQIDFDPMWDILKDDPDVRALLK